MDVNTARILVIPGGGTRGRIPQQFIKHCLAQTGLTASEFFGLFDVIAGASSGAGQAAGYALGMHPDDFDNFILQESKRIFTNRTAAEALAGNCLASTDSLRPNYLQKLGFMLINEPFYKSACSPTDPIPSDWGSNVLYSEIDALFNPYTMADLTTNVVIPVFEADTLTFKYYSNSYDGNFAGQTALVSDVIKATTAAPEYLPSYTFGGHINRDGGLFDNNPVQRALTLAKIKRPLANRFVIIVASTGLGDLGFQVSPTTDIDASLSRLYQYLDIAMTGSQERSNEELKLQANLSLNRIEFYNFQVYFESTYDFDLDLSTDAYFADLDTRTNNRINQDSAAINDILDRLTL